MRRFVMHDNPDLHARIEHLEQQLAELKELAAAPTTGGAASRPAGNRRTMLKLAAASGVAAVAAGVGSQRAAAADGANLVLGSAATNEASTATSLEFDAPGTFTHGIGVTDGDIAAISTEAFGALVGHATGQSFDSGVAGYASGNTFAGVAGESVSGYGVFGRSTTSFGIRGAGFVGGRFLGSSAALSLDSTNQTPAPSRSVAQASNLMEAGNDRDLWWCHTSGTPGKWVKIAGPATAGALHPIDPVRVYDSRVAAPLPGALSANQNRVISVADSRNLDTGAVTLANAVPVGATAVAVNLTITGTSGSGFLAITPGDASTFAASTINWSGAITIANAVIVKLDASRQLKVFCGGAGQADFIIDVQGYWR
jgi:hypothetical protein